MKRIVTNPDWIDVNIAKYELNFIGADGNRVNFGAPHRFRTVEDYNRFLQTGDLKLTVPQFIEVEE